MSFHLTRLNDEEFALKFLPIRDYIQATPGHYYIGQIDAKGESSAPDNFLTDPASVGFTVSPAKGVQRVSAKWFANEDTEDILAAADSFAAMVNGVTALGYTCLVDELASGPPDLTEICSLAIPNFVSPTMVHFYLAHGRDVSYEFLDSPPGDEGAITRALRYGCGLLCEMYVHQGLAERSGRIAGFIDDWFRGPADGKMPYLLRLKFWESSESPIRFVFPVFDKMEKAKVLKGKPRLTKAQFLDMMMQRAFLRFPGIMQNGICTWKWDHVVITAPGSERAGAVVKLLKHYSPGGEGYNSGGRVRFFK